MKQFIVGSGWKMVKTYQDSIDTARELEKRLEGFHEFPVVIFPSFPAIPEICRKLSKESALKIGGQDLFWEDEGAYTGEISGKMLLEIGCQYVEINHQERRKYLHEDNEMANRKLKQALRLSLTPFLCMGEEEEGSDEEVRCFIENQLSELLDGVGEAEASHIILLTSRDGASGRRMWWGFLISRASTTKSAGFWQSGTDTTWQNRLTSSTAGELRWKGAWISLHFRMSMVCLRQAAVFMRICTANWFIQQRRC